MSEEPQKATDTGVTPFAVTTFRNKERVFGIKTDDRRRHVYVLGKTGMGKTTLIENMVYSDIMAGHGVCYVDPHGDTAEKILGWIPSWRINDVIYFNPADIEYPISFNVLEKVDPHYRHLVASGLIGVFKKLWADSWGPRLEYLLRYAILALLEYPDSTLLGINRLLVDKVYRKKVLDKVQDPVVKAFWTDEFSKYGGQFQVEAISPIQNKVGQFLSTSLIRNIVGQVQSTVDLRKIMDEGKILILNLAKGRIGEDASALLGSMMVTKIQLAAMSRVDIHEEKRRDFYLYVDEFQNFVTDSFADILSEARKYRLDLTIAHQYIEQLGEVVQPAVFGNVGTILCFRVGAADAEFLEMEFTPTLTPEDLVNLPKYHFYLKLMIDGVTSEPFSARGLPPVYSASLGNEEKVIRVSREKYAKSRDMVEDKIRRWSLGSKEEEGGGERREERRPAPEGFRREERRFPAERMPSQRESRPTEFRRAEQRFPEEKAPLKPQEASGKLAVKVPQAAVAPAPVPQPQKSVTQKYKAVCANCDKEVEVPFKPDNTRPIFCKDCLKKARRGEIKVAPPKVEEKKEEVAQKPAVSLAEIKKQTVDFKGKALKQEKPAYIPPPPLREVVKPKEEQIAEKKVEEKVEVKQEMPVVSKQAEKKKEKLPAVNFLSQEENKKVKEGETVEL